MDDGYPKNWPSEETRQHMNRDRRLESPNLEGICEGCEFANRECDCCCAFYDVCPHDE